MNQRIKEIYNKALEQHVSNNMAWEELNPEKFAELVVRECYDTIKKDMELAHIQLIPIDFVTYANGRLQRILKEHFEVEE